MKKPVNVSGQAPVLLLLALASCADPSDGATPPSGSSVFSPGVTEVVLEVDYESGAAPVLLREWQLLHQNLEAVFAASPKKLVVPHGLAEMDAFPSDGEDAYTVEEILVISESHRSTSATATRRVYHAVFLDGYYEQDGEVLEDVLGVSIGDTGVIAMFKPVIGSTGIVAGFVEQSTLVHEMGHAVGLVDRGVPITSDHHDDEHPHHCANRSCVMFWANEGAADMVEFLRSRNVDDDTALFGGDCLNDIASHAASYGASP